MGLDYFTILPKMVGMATPRIYDAILREHVGRNRQMALVAGPRQVGKTTTCRSLADAYLDWDNLDDRKVILEGPAAVASHVGLDRARSPLPVLTFDELHKRQTWRTFLKGFFDTYETRVKVIVTGSSKLDIRRRAGDSLMGRYFRYRMHPLSVAELLRQDVFQAPLRPPAEPRDFDILWEHGGFPEPFVRRDRRFSANWRAMRQELLFREDVRDFTGVQQLGQIEVLGTLLAERSGAQLVYSALAREVQVSVDTIKRWVEVLSGLHQGFLLRPWFVNVARALRKEPKWYLRDWSGVDDPGARAETFVACHLLKAVEGWTDLGLGQFELRYLRDKEGREADFLVVRDRKPWFLVEVKLSDAAMSPALAHFQRQTGAPHAFQAVVKMPYAATDCFTRRDPVVVPARTLLSQLL